MNNLGNQSIHEGMQAMALPVREIKTKKPYTPKVKTVEPVDFIPTKPVIKKELHARTDIKTLVSGQDDITTPTQPAMVMPDIYVPSTEIRATKRAMQRKKPMISAERTKQRSKKHFLNSHAIERMQIEAEDYNNAMQFRADFEEIFLIASHAYQAARQANLDYLVDEYETEEDARKIMHTVLSAALDATSVIVHYDFPIIPIAEENFDKKAKQKNLNKLVQTCDIAVKEMMKQSAQTKALADAKKAWSGWDTQKTQDAQLEEDYACWEVNRDMLNFFHDFWEKEAAEYEQMVMPKTIAYEQELIAATTPKTRKYKKKNPNKKKKTDTFVLAGGRMPKRHVPPKQANQQALKQVRAMFNNANRGIQYHINPGHIK